MKLRYRTPLSTAAMMTLAFLGGCVSVPDGVQPVSGVELDRYLGRWYEIAGSTIDLSAACPMSVRPTACAMTGA